MTFLIILLLTLFQLITGFGLLTLFRIQLKPAFYWPLCILMGLAVFSIVPFILQLLFIPITYTTVFTGLAIASLLLNVQCRRGWNQVRLMFAVTKFQFKVYEIPFLATIAFLMLVSVWRCYYYLPTPLDALSGAEVLAEYTVREKTMINSVFMLEPSGNTLKPPFLTCLQIIYKFAGFPPGQVWLCNVFICITIILYHLLCSSLHRLLAGLLIVLFTIIPEMYAYTFMILYDYSNAAFFFLSVYFLTLFFRNEQNNYLLFAGLLMGFATYMRPEMPMLAVLIVPAIVWHFKKQRAGVVKMIRNNVVFLLPTALFYLVSVTLYINYYLPKSYSVMAQINPSLVNGRALLKQFSLTVHELIFSKSAIDYYGYFIFLFLALFLAELIVKRRFNDLSRNYLYVLLIVFLAYPTLSHALPGLTVEHSVKRAFLKLFPLMLIYMSQNALLKGLSDKMYRWENGR